MVIEPGAGAPGYEVRDRVLGSVGQAFALLGTLLATGVIASSLLLVRGEMSRLYPALGVAAAVGGVLVGLLAVLCAVVLVDLVARALRHALVVAVDERGVTLGSELLERRRFVAWADVERVLAYTLLKLTGSGEDPTTSYTHYIHVGVRDGAKLRRVVSRKDQAALTEAVRRLAPDVRFYDLGLMDVGTDPHR